MNSIQVSQLFSSSAFFSCGVVSFPFVLGLGANEFVFEGAREDFIAGSRYTVSDLLLFSPLCFHPLPDWRGGRRLWLGRLLEHSHHDSTPTKFGVRYALHSNSELAYMPTGSGLAERNQVWQTY